MRRLCRSRTDSTRASEPLWARNGREVFYRSSSGKVWAVKIGFGSGLTLGKPRLLFDHPGFWGYLARPRLGYLGERRAVPNGQTRRPQAHPSHRTVPVQNWFEELKRLAPGPKNSAIGRRFVAGGGSNQSRSLALQNGRYARCRSPRKTLENSAVAAKAVH
jgi:hypothetical protein